MPPITGNHGPADLRRPLPQPPLPTRDGVGPSCVGLPPGDWPTMLDFLAERFPKIARSTWRERMAVGDVVDESGARVLPQSAYLPHRRLYYYRAIEAEPVLPFEATVLHHDDHLLVVDKPHFVPVTPGGRYLQQSLLVRLKRQLGIDALVPVHRIDRETAGLVLFSTRPATRAHYAALFSGRTIRKRYEAIVPWTAGQVLPSVHRSRLVPDDAFVRTREVPGEPNAETAIELLQARDDRARLELRPLTGRRHQLRVQCAALGMPILNDRIYPEWLPEGSDDVERPLQLLAAALAFVDPVSGAERHFESRLRLRLDAPGPLAMPAGSPASSNHCPTEPRRGES